MMEQVNIRVEQENLTSELVNMVWNIHVKQASVAFLQNTCIPSAAKYIRYVPHYLARDLLVQGLTLLHSLHLGLPYRQ